MKYHDAWDFATFNAWVADFFRAIGGELTRCGVTRVYLASDLFLARGASASLLAKRKKATRRATRVSF